MTLAASVVLSELLSADFHRAVLFLALPALAGASCTERLPYLGTEGEERPLDDGGFGSVFRRRVVGPPGRVYLLSMLHAPSLAVAWCKAVQAVASSLKASSR
jgi:hypothetical protein